MADATHVGPFAQGGVVAREIQSAVAYSTHLGLFAQGAGVGMAEREALVLPGEGA